MGIDNPNFSVINRLLVQDVMYEEFKGIGRYWNLLARKLGRAKPAGITRFFPIFLPRFLSLFRRLYPSLNRRSTSIRPLRSISLFLVACHVVRPSASICLLSESGPESIRAQGIPGKIADCPFKRGYTSEYTRESDYCSNGKSY